MEWKGNLSSPLRLSHLSLGSEGQDKMEVTSSYWREGFKNIPKSQFNLTPLGWSWMVRDKMKREWKSIWVYPWDSGTLSPGLDQVNSLDINSVKVSSLARTACGAKKEWKAIWVFTLETLSAGLGRRKKRWVSDCSLLARLLQVEIAKDTEKIAKKLRTECQKI